APAAPAPNWAGTGRFRPLPFGAVANTSAAGPMYLASQADKFVFDAWGRQTVMGVPFTLPDPFDARDTIITLHSPLSELCQSKPRSAQLPVRAKVKTLHVLSGVSAFGWPWGGFPGQPETGTPKGVTTVVVRLHYEDGKTEDHEW